MSLADLGGDLVMQLAVRRDEIEAAINLRVAAVPSSTEVRDPLYADGLRAAPAVALDYGLAMLASNGRGRVEVPAALRAQARLAARSRIGLDTVLRRYFVGYTLVGDFLVQEAEKASMSGDGLQRILRVHAAGFDRLVATITEEYCSEAELRPRSSESRRAKLVEDLLEGELVDTDELNYDFELNHLGLIAIGVGGMEAIRTLALEFDCRLLLVCQDEATVWAWMGTTRDIDPEPVRRLGDGAWPEGKVLAIGEVSPGVRGWRLTHQQARAALLVATRDHRRVARYVDVAIVAAALKDDVFVRTLRERFLRPLMGGRDGGATLLETLRAYFTAQRNASSAAAALDVSRQTVINRLKVVEERLGLALGTCAVELEVALRLIEIE